MSKALSAALDATYQQTTTELCNLLKITARDGTVLGITSAEEDITYNDGAGDVTYSASVGMDTYALDSSADLAVDNTEVDMLLADSGKFSDEQINAGVLDYGEYVVYRINRLDHAEGHEILDTGTIGIVKNVDGVAGVIELRSLQQQLKQTYGELDSLTCRAEFGSGGGGTCIFRGQCGFDAESLWQNHSVNTVGAETDREFTADSSPAVNGPNGALTFAPGLVQWLTGDNAGLTSEVEAVDGADITLRFGTPYTIQAGDTFKIRPDCDKTWETCRDDYDNILNFRGEPKIPLADENSQSTPGTGSTPAPEPPEAETPPPAPPDPPPPPPDPPPPSTEIVNAGFESGGTGWLGSDWVINKKQPRTGSYSAEFTKEDIEGSLTNAHRVPVSPGTNVQAQCWVKAGQSGSMGARCMLRWFDADEIEIGNDYGTTKTSTSWSQSSVSANAPAGTAFVVAGAQAQNPFFEGSVFVDDFTWNL